MIDTLQCLCILAFLVLNAVVVVFLIARDSKPTPNDTYFCSGWWCVHFVTCFFLLFFGGAFKAIGLTCCSVF